MLTSGEVQVALGVTEQTLGRWRKSGMPCHRVGTKTYRYDADDIRAWQLAKIEPVPQEALAELVHINRSLTAMAPIKLAVHGLPTTLQAYALEEILLLAEMPAGEDRDQTARDMVGFVRTLLSIQ